MEEEGKRNHHVHPINSLKCVSNSKSSSSRRSHPTCVGQPRTQIRVGRKMWQSPVMMFEIETSCRGIVFLHRTTEEHISPSCHDGAQKSNGNGTHKTRGRGALGLEAPAKQMEASRHTCGSTMETYVGTTCKLKIECVHCAIEAKRSVLGRPGTSRANTATGRGNSLRTQTRVSRVTRSPVLPAGGPPKCASGGYAVAPAVPPHLAGMGTSHSQPPKQLICGRRTRTYCATCPVCHPMKRSEKNDAFRMRRTVSRRPAGFTVQLKSNASVVAIFKSTTT